MRPEGEPRPRHDHPRWWLVVAGLAAVAAFVAHDRLLGLDTYYGLFGNKVDAEVYRYGGHTVRTAEPLYDFVLHGALPFTYPPFAAIVFLPLSILTLYGAQLAVTFLNLVLVYAATRLCWKQLGYVDSARTRFVSITLAVLFTWLEPVRMTIWPGQINLVLLVLVLWDLGRPEGSRLRGVGVGIAAGLKLTPLFFVAYLAVLRQWRAVAVAVGTFAATVAVGFVVVFSDSVQFWTSTIIHSDRIGLVSSPANQSVRGILARSLHTETPAVWLWLLCAGRVGVLGLWAAYLADRNGHRLLGLTVAGLTAPMVAPFSWGHHWVWTIPLLVLCLHRAAQWRRWWGHLLPFAVAVPLLAWYRSYPDGVVAIGTFMTPGPPVQTALLQAAYPIVHLGVVTTVIVANRPARIRLRHRDDRPTVDA